MNLVRYRTRTNPFALLDEMTRDLGLWNGNGDTFLPPMDVTDEEDRFEVRLEVPGVRPEDLDIQVEQNVLTIRGEKKNEHETKDGRFRRVERRYGSFERRIHLGQDVDQENIEARFEHGVLTVRIPRAEKARPRQVAVEMN